MEITYIGMAALIFAVGVIAIFPTKPLQFLMFSALLGSASVINLSALGNSSIPPGYFALATFLVCLLRIHVPKYALVTAFRANAGIILFAVWASFGAWCFPRLFAGTLDVVPMNPGRNLAIFYMEPLIPTSRNVTQALYIIGTAVASCVACVAAFTNLDSKKNIIGFILMLGLAHVSFGLVDLVASNSKIGPILDIVRNGNYAQLNQNEGSFHRIAGTFAESSSYSAFGMPIFVFSFEIWLRKLYPLIAGLTASTLAAALLLSTSSSAYFGLGFYAAFLMVRFILGSKFLRKQTLVLVILLLTASLIVLVVFLNFGDFAGSFSTVIQQATVGKSQSFSGVQRGFWAQQALDAFWQTRGVGVGVGSFRSSGLLLAILGSTGILGALLLLTFVWKFTRVIVRGRSIREPGQAASLQAAQCAAWAALIGIGPALAAGATPDPGILFGVFSGLSLGWAAQVNGGQRHAKRLATYLTRSMRDLQKAAVDVDLTT